MATSRVDFRAALVSFKPLNLLGTQIQIHTYKYTDTDTDTHIHKYTDTDTVERVMRVHQRVTTLLASVLCRAYLHY